MKSISGLAVNAKFQHYRVGRDHSKNDFDIEVEEIHSTMFVAVELCRVHSILNGRKILPLIFNAGIIGLENYKVQWMDPSKGQTNHPLAEIFCTTEGIVSNRRF